MNPTETYNPRTRPTSRAWERFKQSQVWAANAPLPLMVQLLRTSRLVSQQVEEATQVTLPQMRILFEALEPEGVSQSTLHKHYLVDPAAITRTVQAMERDGLITRSSDPSDNRFMRVFITDKGRQLIEATPPRMAEYEQRMVKGLTDSEILQLHALLERIEIQLTDEGQTPLNSN